MWESREVGYPTVCQRDKNFGSRNVVVTSDIVIQLRKCLFSLDFSNQLILLQWHRDCSTARTLTINFWHRSCLLVDY